jgi:hypothetical protein
MNGYRTLRPVVRQDDPGIGVAVLVARQHSEHPNTTQDNGGLGVKGGRVVCSVLAPPYFGSQGTGVWMA